REFQLQNSRLSADPGHSYGCNNYVGKPIKTYHDAELKIERGDTSKAAILLRNDAHKKLEANNE
ncbi:MAG: hypothetical protein LBR28_00590, partial [Bacteroidales bacterium]|nr:hypothetical protein [Bacteroidales bacterium]